MAQLFKSAAYRVQLGAAERQLRRLRRKHCNPLKDEQIVGARRAGPVNDGSQSVFRKVGTGFRKKHAPKQKPTALCMNTIHCKVL